MTSNAIPRRRSPNDTINVAQIGFGRIAKEHDLPLTILHEGVRIVAVADVDLKRVGEGKQGIEDWYRQNRGEQRVEVKACQDYHELLGDKSIDAVIISTPDHWHAQPAIEAALAGKDVYLQKPTSLTIKEGRQMSDAFHRTGRILQVGSQQRSLDPWPQFHRAVELVRNGRIGDITHVEVGLMIDPSGKDEPVMPIPENLDYDMWLGSTPYVYYTEKRVHPQRDYDRPGWLRCEQFCAGMITGWGTHHVDTAHWGMDTEYTGPVEIEGEAEFPTSGLWTVHGHFNVEARYANGVILTIADRFPNGIRFIGTEGWLFVSRGEGVSTASDPSFFAKKAPALEASEPRILDSVIGPDEIQIEISQEQHQNWLDSIRTRKPPIAPVEIAHRSGSVCLISQIAMRLRRRLYWNPDAERFRNDDEANGMVSRPQRYPYGTDYIQY